MTLAVNAKNGPISLPEQKLSLAPESAGELRWPMQAGDGVSAQTWEFTAREEGGSASDTLRITQQIAPAVPVTVQQASFMRIASPLELAVTRPPGALPDKGGLEIALSPRLATPPPGLRVSLRTTRSAVWSNRPRLPSACMMKNAGSASPTACPATSTRRDWPATSPAPPAAPRSPPTCSMSSAWPASPSPKTAASACCRA